MSFTSLWSHFLANVAELASDWRMFVTPRIRQKELGAQEFYPAPRSMIFYRTPPLPPTFPRHYDLLFSRGIGRAWASDGFTAAPRKGSRLLSGSSRRRVRTARLSAR